MEAIKEAIEQLAEPDRRKLVDWLDDLEEQAWDAEIERDFAPGGRGTPLLKQIQREVAEGNARPMEEGFAKRRKPRA